MAAGRSKFVRAYSRAYRGGSPRRPGQQRSWLTVHAAARLAEDIDAEQQVLTGLLRRAVAHDLGS
jgi:hypothetical protein